MKLTLILAWRNVWRNSRRTIITAAALAVGVSTMSLMTGLMLGMMDKMARVATASRTGDAQIHAKNYPKTKDELLVLDDTPALLKHIRTHQEVRVATPRVWGLGLVAIGDRSAGIELVGIDLKEEQKATNWKTRLVEGSYLDAPGQVIIGKKLAEKLDVELDSKLVMTVANIHTGEASTELLRIKGLLYTGDMNLDRGTAIIDITTAQRLMGLGHNAHEITLRMHTDQTDKLAFEGKLKQLQTPGLIVRPWYEINRMVGQFMDMQDKMLDFIVFFVFIIISFGIVNTISMSLLERRREFGILRAIGTTPSKLGALIVTEAGYLGLIGAVPGILLGLTLSFWLAQEGLDMSQTTAYGMTFSEPIYGKVDVFGTIRIGIIFIILTMLTSLFSARRAAKIDPIEAMRG